MMTFFEIYFGIGLICLIIDAFAYWGSNGYTTSDKINGSIICFLFWPILVLGFIGLWLIGLKIDYDKKHANQ